MLATISPKTSQELRQQIAQMRIAVYVRNVVTVRLALSGSVCARWCGGWKMCMGRYIKEDNWCAIESNIITVRGSNKYGFVPYYI